MQHKKHKQPMGQQQHGQRIDDRQADDPPHLGQPPGRSGQALQGHREPSGPESGLDDHPINLGKDLRLGRHHLRQALASRGPLAQLPRQPPQTPGNFLAQVQQPPLQRHPRARQGGHLIAQRDQIVERNLSRRQGLFSRLHAGLTHSASFTRHIRPRK
jgi:hypothetical protein